MQTVVGQDVDRLVVVSKYERPLYMWLNHLLFDKTLWTHMYWLMLRVKPNDRYGIIMSINNSTGEKLAWRVTQEDMVGRGDVDPLKTKDGKLPVITSLEKIATEVVHKSEVDFRACLTPEEIMKKVEECRELSYVKHSITEHTFYTPRL